MILLTGLRGISLCNRRVDHEERASRMLVNEFERVLRHPENVPVVSFWRQCRALAPLR